MKIPSIKNMIRPGTVFGSAHYKYSVDSIDYDLKFMWLREEFSDGEFSSSFKHTWTEDSSFKDFDLIFQREPLKLEDLI